MVKWSDEISKGQKGHTRRLWGHTWRSL